MTLGPATPAAIASHPSPPHALLGATMSLRRSIHLGLALAITTLTASAQQPSDRAQLFLGYSYLDPHATLTGVLPGGVLPINTCLCAIPRGAGGSFVYFVKPWLGLTVDSAGHISPQQSTPALEAGHSTDVSVAAGPTFTLHRHHLAPFGELLFGVDRLSPQLFTPDTRFALLAGGGLDLPLGRHFGIRLFQADFDLANHHFGTFPNAAGTNVRGIRLQSGVLFRFGAPAAAPIAAPHPTPAPVIQAAAPIPVAAPAAAPIPLTLSLSANPAVVTAGQTSLITGVAAGAAPLNLTFAANAGNIAEQQGNTALLSTAGMGAGIILITGNVTDNLGQTAQATTQVQVLAAEMPRIAAITQQGAISFARDTRRPARVDNEAKAQLDILALAFLHSAQDTQPTLVLVAEGAHNAAAQRLAAQRAVNTKAYLVTEKGIDANRIALYTTTAPGASVELFRVPAGATFTDPNATPVNESTLHPQPRHTR